MVEYLVIFHYMLSYFWVRRWNFFLKIGQHLAKLWARVGCPVFLTHGGMADQAFLSACYRLHMYIFAYIHSNPLLTHSEWQIWDLLKNELQSLVPWRGRRMQPEKNTRDTRPGIRRTCDNRPVDHGLSPQTSQFHCRDQESINHIQHNAT